MRSTTNRSESSFIVKMLRNLVLILLLIVFISIVYNFRNRESSTNVALLAEASASRSMRGVFIRDEQVLTYSGSGALSYAVADGGKLGNGTVIANVYPNDEQIGIYREIESLTKQLDILKKIQNPGTLQAAQPSVLSDSISECYRSLIYDRDMKDYTALRSEMEELLVEMSTYQIITNEVANFDQQISDINTQLAQLSAKAVSPTEVKTSDRPAYFVSYADGYEEELTPDKLDSITVDELRRITDERLEDDKIVGKLIEGYGWYLAGIMDNSRKEFAVGEELKLRFDNGADLYDAVITDIRDSGDPKESIFIISCSEFNYDLVQHRVENVELVKGSYRGLKVPREAIRFADVTETPEPVEGQEPTEATTANTVSCKGVYILKGEQVEFKKIDVIYEGSDYVLSKLHENDPDYLTLYDDIILEGVDSNGQ
ncbi:MAG TPA: hypothetical protein DCZ62_08120 [Ruminococcus sp.]|nr:hypothetical protein [Ruminococcus sp.]